MTAEDECELLLLYADAAEAAGLQATAQAMRQLYPAPAGLALQVLAPSLPLLFAAAGVQARLTTPKALRRLFPTPTVPPGARELWAAAEPEEGLTAFEALRRMYPPGEMIPPKALEPWLRLLGRVARLPAADQPAHLADLIDLLVERLSGRGGM